MSSVLICLLFTTLQFEALFAQDLKSIFHIPSKRNYDELEILERSNFGEDPSPASRAELPRPYANAQVIVRFGGDFEKGRCSCGERCQCRNTPVATPLPYCWCQCAPPPVAPVIHAPVQALSFAVPPQVQPIQTVHLSQVQRPQFYAPPIETVHLPQMQRPQFYAPPIETVHLPQVQRPQFYAPPRETVLLPQVQRPQFYAPPMEPVHLSQVQRPQQYPVPVVVQRPCMIQTVTPQIQPQPNYEPIPVPQIQLRPLPVTPPAKLENVSPAPPPPVPATPPCDPEEINQVKKENMDDGNVEINKNNHPEIMKTVDLSEDIIKSPINEISTEKQESFLTTTVASNEVSSDTTAKLLEEVSNKLEPKELSPNVKLVDFDVSTAPGLPKQQLEDSLIPYRSPHLQQQKLLVTYPIFNRAEEPPMVQYTSGYSVSGGAGYYSDPTKTLMYKEPTVVSVVPPQVNIVGEPRERYILVPVVQPAPSTHSSDCGCCGCSKYRGELNQYEKM